MKKRLLLPRAILIAFLVICGSALIKVNAMDRGGTTEYQRSSGQNDRTKENTNNRSKDTREQEQRGDSRYQGKNEGEENSSEDSTEPDMDEPEENAPVDGDTYHFTFEWEWKGGRTINCDISMKDIEMSEKELDVLEHSKDPFTLLGIDWKRYNENERNVLFWRNLYRYLLSKNTDRIENLIKRFTEIRDREKMDNRLLLECILTFVQNLKYKRPGGTLDVLAQPNALYRKFGDCDTKSLLLVTILEHLGYDTVIYYSSYYSHVMAGIYMNGSGEYKKIDGKKYYFVETTYPGWKPGTLPPDFKNTRYWEVCRIH